jgi:hypothetical protein
MEVSPLPDIFLHLSIVLFLWLGIVVPRFTIFSLSFFLWVVASHSLLLLWGVPRPKLLCIFFKIMLNFDDISIGQAQGGDVQKINFFLDVSM